MTESEPSSSLSHLIMTCVHVHSISFKCTNSTGKPRLCTPTGFYTQRGDGVSRWENITHTHPAVTINSSHSAFVFHCTGSSLWYLWGSPKANKNETHTYTKGGYLCFLFMLLCLIQDSGVKQQKFRTLERLIEHYRSRAPSDVAVPPLTDPLDKTEIQCICSGQGITHTHTNFTKSHKTMEDSKEWGTKIWCVDLCAAPVSCFSAMKGQRTFVTNTTDVHRDGLHGDVWWQLCLVRPGRPKYTNQMDHHDESGVQDLRCVCTFVVGSILSNRRLNILKIKILQAWARKQLECISFPVQLSHVKSLVIVNATCTGHT